MTQQRVLLVDVSAFSHMAWHAYPDCYDKDGRNVKVLSGILSKIRRLERSYEWDCLVSVMDPEGGSLHRKAIYPEYKAHRPEPEEDFTRQRRGLFQQLRVLGLNPLMVPGVESDDVIASLSLKMAFEGHLVMMVSPDKDMAQMVESHENVAWLRPVRDDGSGAGFEFLDSSGVMEAFGVWPRQIPDFLALVGDVSDNLPGVPKVGKKTAAKLLEKYGTAESILAMADEIPGVVGANLRGARDLLPTVKRLTTLLTDVDVGDLSALMTNERSDESAGLIAELNLPNGLWDFAFQGR